MGGIYVGIFILIIVLRYMAGRRPGTLADLTPRERFLPEKVLTWSAQLLAFAVVIELCLKKLVFLTSAEAYWLNVLPFLWLALTGSRKDIPSDRTATNVGLWTLAPYAAYIFSPRELPESTWVSMCLFGAAFFVAIWRDTQHPG